MSSQAFCAHRVMNFVSNVTEFAAASVRMRRSASAGIGEFGPAEAGPLHALQNRPDAEQNHDEAQNVRQDKVEHEAGLVWQPQRQIADEHYAEAVVDRGKPAHEQQSAPVDRHVGPGIEIQSGRPEGFEREER